ncbi:MAG: hypothetical protein RIS44_2302 [Pseudomonadota bacterium]|jgi:hypothetical protein
MNSFFAHAFLGSHEMGCALTKRALGVPCNARFELRYSADEQDCRDCP